MKATVHVCVNDDGRTVEVDTRTEADCQQADGQASADDQVGAAPDRWAQG